MATGGMGFGGEPWGNSGNNGTKQRFNGALNEDGELPITGVNLLSLDPVFGYTSLPGDVNNGLYMVVNSNVSATLKNKGGAENQGATVKGYFS